MFKKLCTSIFISILTISSFVFAEIDYEIQDIGTLQTHSSQAIALNNQGQILGWYDVDGSQKHFFVRDKDGTFHEINDSVVYQNVPKQFCNIKIDWRYLTDGGVAYGIYNCPNSAEFFNSTGLKNDNPILYMWNQQNGVFKVGQLPAKEVSAINNAGQVLIKSVSEYRNGKLFFNPVIWQNGKITKLRGLEGDLGIESEESYGFDLNNNGEVVGQSVAYISYKNDIYKQIHAVKWINGQAIDLHKEVPKSASTCATAINDLGDVIVGTYLIRADGKRLESYLFSCSKANNTKYFLALRNGYRLFLDRDGNQTQLAGNKIFDDYDCIWMYLDRNIDMNDNGEVIAQGVTIYGEQHAMLLTPIKPN